MDRDLIGPARYDLKAGTWNRLFEVDWDTGVSIDWTGSHLALVKNQDGYTDVALHDPDSLARTRSVPLPHRGIGGTSFSKDGRSIGITFTSPAEPGDAWLYDIGSHTSTRLTTSPNPVPADVFVQPECHRFTSFDGEQIPVFLYRPREVRDDAPVVVWIHGGPESQYVPSFNALVQYMTYRGYAVAAPNVRGSTGYGKRYHLLDDKRKRLDSVRDLASLHDWLRTTPGVDHTRAALMGGSYGGYMVLAGLAFQPDLWAAGVDIVGISSLVTFLENTAPWRRKFREREYGSLEHDRDFLLEASPLTHVDDIRAPLFIIHGANDPRVPVGEARQVHAALQAKKIPTEILVYEDEGHGLGKLRNRLDAYPKALDFLDGVLRR
jgi:dipeptidyl aminopeptidase/acylaminoacyl peptidase